ncbi:phage tail protein, partial [Escherichia coli]|nr:phage tail protein [Escherichia coli]
FSEAGFSNNCAILMGYNQRITVGTGPANTTHLSFNWGEKWANFNNLRIRLNGNQVISERRTGWGSPTGTVSRAAFNSGTITHEDLAKVVAALI